MHFIKQTFIPHKHNCYRPHLIRRHGIALAVFLILAVQMISSLQINARPQVLAYATNVSISGLLSATNAERSAAGKSLLTINTKLNNAAQGKANHMITNDYWAHTSPDGVTPWYWFDNAGYEYLTAGENLAYGFDTSSGVVTGWMNSPSHRDNLLNSTFEHVGFGIANGSDYQGDENTVVVAMYGDPAVLSETSPPPSNSSPTEPADPAPTPAVTEPETTPPADNEETTPVKETEATKPVEETSTTPASENSVVDLNSLKTDDLQVRTQIAPEQGKQISNIEAILTGQAGWSLYFVTSIVVLFGFVYAYRHVLFVHGAIIKSEKYLISHPMLEASIIYGIIWLILAGSFGAVL